MSNSPVVAHPKMSCVHKGLETGSLIVQSHIRGHNNVLQDQPHFTWLVQDHLPIYKYVQYYA